MSEPRRRTTRQRLAVDAVLRSTSDFLSAQQVHLRLREAGEGIGLATVYRTLGQMFEDGRLDMIRGIDGEAKYRFCTTDRHHHHLVCRECGSAVEVDLPGTETWMSSIGGDYGYTDVSHTIELFGRCGPCTTRAGGDG